MYPNSHWTTRQVCSKYPLWAINLVITPACLYTFGRAYLVLSMWCIHWTPHIAHVVLLLVISSSHSLVRLFALTIYQYIQYSVSTCNKLVIASSKLRIMFFMSNYYASFYACLVMFDFSFTLSYMISTFQVLTHTCTTFSHDVGVGSQHPDHV